MTNYEVQKYTSKNIKLQRTVTSKSLGNMKRHLF